MNYGIRTTDHDLWPMFAWALIHALSILQELSKETEIYISMWKLNIIWYKTIYIYFGWRYHLLVTDTNGIPPNGITDQFSVCTGRFSNLFCPILLANARIIFSRDVCRIGAYTWCARFATRNVILGHDHFTNNTTSIIVTWFETITALVTYIALVKAACMVSRTAK